MGCFICVYKTSGVFVILFDSLVVIRNPVFDMSNLFVSQLACC